MFLVRIRQSLQRKRVENQPSPFAPSGGPASARLAQAFIAGLVSGGVRHFVVSPGSRSTPLVLALSQFPEIQSRVILDERSAAFFALGLADRMQLPVALVCTSGTAGANYYPAVIEASERDLPILILTADRPPELQDCGAGQTINQTNLFGRYVRRYLHGIADEGQENSAALYNLARAGLEVAKGEHSGPVHFNLPFREPFLPAADTPPELPEEEPVPFQYPVPPEQDWSELRKSGPGWILAGAANPHQPQKWANGLFQLSDYLGWPIFSDVLNPLRQSAGGEERIVTQYEGLISSGILEKQPALRPQAILQVGIQPTAKPLRQWLAGFDGPRWQWSARSQGLDPARKPFTWISGSPEHLNEIPAGFSEEEFRGSWLDLEKTAIAEVTEWVSKQPHSFEGGIHFRLGQAVPRNAQIFIANSMPVRDAERFWFADRPRGPRVFSNRGASGIDGLVSTAAGLADGGPPTIAVLGDLAFLHDCGGLRAAQGIDGSLTFVVIDNGGGRIFSQLPIAREAAVFESFFLTPQKVDLKQLCAAHQIPVAMPGSNDPLGDYLQLDKPGVRVVLIKTDPSTDETSREAWRDLFARVTIK